MEHSSKNTKLIFGRAESNYQNHEYRLYEMKRLALKWTL
jgi:hypothetical protein